MEAPRWPVRIAFCITDLGAGGAERALAQLVTRLDRDRWEPAVFCLSGPGELVAPLAAAGVPVTCLGARSAGNLLVLPRLVRRLRRFGPALLQTYLYHANILGRVAGRLAGLPRIVSGIRVAEKRSRFRLWLDRTTAGLVDRHVCVSQGVATFSIDRGGLPAERVLVIPNGVDVERFANAEPADLSEFAIPAGSRVLLFVGRLDPQKAPDLLIEAAQRALADRPDAHLVLVGTGPLRGRIAARIGQGSLAGRIHLAGPRNDVPALLQSSLALVLPSRWEGLPNVVLEAMAAARPVVATAVEGTTELVRPGETGLLVPPESVDALAAAISQILDRPADAAAMGRAAQQVARRRFTWDDAVRKYHELYETLVAE